MKNGNTDRIDTPGIVAGDVGKVFKSISTSGITEDGIPIWATLEYINLNKRNHMYVKVQLKGSSISTPFFVGELFRSITKTSSRIMFCGQRFRFCLTDKPSVSFSKEDLFAIVPGLKRIVSKAQTPKAKKPEEFVAFAL